MPKFLAYTGVAILSLFGGTAGQANANELVSALSPSGVVTPAGERVLFYDGSNVLVLDPAKGQSAEWRSIAPPDGNSFDGSLECSADGMGICVVGLVNQGNKRLGLIDAERASITDTGVGYDEVLFASSIRQIYITRSYTNGSRQVFSVNGEGQGEALVGTLSPEERERFVLLPMGGVLTPAFASEEGRVRFPGSGNQASALPGAVTGRSTSSSGVFIANDLFQKYSDGRERVIFGLSTYSRDGSGAIAHSFDGFETVLPSRSLPLPPSYTIDRHGNAIGLTADEDGLRLVAPCVVDEAAGQSRRASKQIRSFPSLAQVKVSGAGRGDGIVLRIRQPGEVESILYVRFDGAASRRFGETPCAELNLAASSLGPIPGTSMPDGWTESVHELTLQDGTVIAGTLLRREGVATERLIVDVYGASGLLRAQLAVPNAFLESDEMDATAIYYPVLPGDGNMGWGFANASRSPDRDRAVNVLAQVVAKAKSELLASDGRTYLRGGSAGGWLAIKTALAHPGLADEVISISGAYSFEPDDDGITLADFFRIDDSINDEEVGRCGTTFFRLIHGTEDMTIPFARVQKFASLMSANECEGALHVAEGGTHNLTNFTTLATNPETRNIVNWAHGID